MGFEVRRRTVLRRGGGTCFQVSCLGYGVQGAISPYLCDISKINKNLIIILEQYYLRSFNITVPSCVNSQLLCNFFEVFTVFSFSFKVWFLVLSLGGGAGSGIRGAQRATISAPVSRNRCRGNSAHIRQSGPESDPGFQAKADKTFTVVPFIWLKFSLIYHYTYITIHRITINKGDIEERSDR